MVRVRVKIIDTDQEWLVEAENGAKIRDVLEKLDLNPEEYIVSRNGEVVSEDEEVGEDDLIILYPVVSGG